MNKRGQTTLFVVIGIIIIILIGLGIYYRGSITSLFEGKTTQSEAFNANTNTVKTYVENCLYQTGEEAINIISLQGGYLEVPEDPLAIDQFNVLSNTLTVLPGLYVPYWYYHTANGITRNQIPTTKNMEKEIGQYLDENFGTCINHFVGIEPILIQDNKPTFIVSITDDIVDIKANYPLTITQENFTSKLTTFQQGINVPLGRYYNTAVEIMSKENRETFLENITIDQFVVYDELPYSGIDLECSPRIWEKTQVTQDLKNILSANIGHLKIKGSSYTLPKEQKYYELAGVKTPEKTSIQFVYSQDWPLFMETIPNDPILTGESYNDNTMGRFITQFFCLNYYNFVYDLTYPVLISLTDDNTGYTFQYATQVIIDNNQPRQSAEFIPLDTETSKVCDYPTTPITVNVQGYSANGNIVDLPDAKITLNCGGPTCTLGKTNSAGSLNTVASQCLNANIRAERKDYHYATEVANTIDTGTINLILEPEKKLNLTIAIAREDGGTRSLIQGERILIQAVNQDEVYSAGAFYPDQQTITLIPGNYELHTTLIKEKPNGFNLKSEEIETCIKKPAGVLGFIGITSKKCSKTTLEGIQLDNVIMGGTNTNFTVSRNELLNSNSITIYTVVNKEPTQVTDLQEIYNKISNNTNNQDYKEPQFK